MQNLMRGKSERRSGFFRSYVNQFFIKFFLYFWEPCGNTNWLKIKYKIIFRSTFVKWQNHWNFSITWKMLFCPTVIVLLENTAIFWIYQTGELTRIFIFKNFIKETMFSVPAVTLKELEALCLLNFSLLCFSDSFQ